MERDGFLIIDKPTNMISHEVSSYVKKILKAKKAGHSGTLDPSVSGVLIVGINRATRLLRFITREDKVYVGVVKFGKEMNYREVSQLFRKFTGVITQIPPEMSAVAKRKRKRRVDYIKALEIKGEYVLFETKVESGTYIRTLCKDMGGEMVELRRVRVGSFDEREAYTLDEIYAFSVLREEGYESFLETAVLRVEEVFERLSIPKVSISKHTAKNLIKGASLYENGIIGYERFDKGDYVSIFCEDKLVGIGKAECSSYEMEGKVIKPERIHMREKDLGIR